MTVWVASITLRRSSASATTPLSIENAMIGTTWTAPTSPSASPLRLAAALSARQAPAQVPARPTPATPAGRGERAPDYPERPPAPPEQVAHGQQLFSGNCSFCHGSDARGGEKGPNLVRAQVVLDDQHGELITPIVQNGIPAQGMPKFALSETDIADIAAWLHGQPLSDRGTPSSLDVLVGNARE